MTTYNDANFHDSLFLSISHRDTGYDFTNKNKRLKFQNDELMRIYYLGSDTNDDGRSCFYVSLSDDYPVQTVIGSFTDILKFLKKVIIHNVSLKFIYSEHHKHESRILKQCSVLNQSRCDLKQYLALLIY